MTDWALFLIRSKKTGRILGSYRGTHAEAAGQAKGPDEEVVSCDMLPDMNTNWIPPGTYELQPRPVFRPFNKALIQADGKDEARLEDVPPDAKVSVICIPNEPVSVELDTEHDGTLRFVTTTPGRYRITVEAFPFLPFSAEIQAS